MGVVNKASAAYQRKLLETCARGGLSAMRSCKAKSEKAKQKAIDAYADYVSAISTGREVDDVMRYDSTDVLKGVVDRLENLNAIGIFKAKPPPFDRNAAVWRYDIRALERARKNASCSCCSGWRNCSPRPCSAVSEVDPRCDLSR